HLYADATALSAQAFREAGSEYRPDCKPEQALALFLGQFIYGVPDDERGVYSALRGHDLARNMYGWNDDVDSKGNRVSPNNVPFNGVGRMHFTPGLPPAMASPKSVTNGPGSLPPNGDAAQDDW